MTAQGARLIEDGKTIFVGWGIPQVVAMLAQKLYVPNVTQLFEFGAIGPQSVLPFVRGKRGRKPGGLPLLEDDHRHQARGAPVRPERRLPDLPGVSRRSGSPREGGIASRHRSLPSGHLEGPFRVRRAEQEDDPPLGASGTFGG